MLVERRQVLLLAVTVVAGCSRFTVETHYDRSAAFSALRTYAWRPGPQPRPGDPRIDSAAFDERVRSAIMRALARKGLHPAIEGAKPDFLVAYAVALRPNTRAEGTPDDEEGTLQIDILDPTDMKLLWRGAGVSVIDPNASRATREKKINAAVAQILSRFPPKIGVSLW
jgi:hypothetical protein